MDEQEKTTLARMKQRGPARFLFSSGLFRYTLYATLGGLTIDMLRGADFSLAKIPERILFSAGAGLFLCLVIWLALSRRFGELAPKDRGGE